MGYWTGLEGSFVFRFRSFDQDEVARLAGVESGLGVLSYPGNAMVGVMVMLRVRVRVRVRVRWGYGYA